MNRHRQMTGANTKVKVKIGKYGKEIGGKSGKLLT